MSIFKKIKRRAILYPKIVKMKLRSGINGVDGFKHRNRVEHLLRTVPDVFEKKTVLYIGASPNRNQLVSEFKAHGCIVDLLEVCEQNIEINRHVFNDCYLGDARTFIPEKKYDATVFWHGIEHIEKHELVPMIENMKKYTNELILFGCPYGVAEQGAIYGNKHEIHVSHWNERELWDRGLCVSSIGKYNSGHSNLVSYIRL